MMKTNLPRIKLSIMIAIGSFLLLVTLVLAPSKTSGSDLVDITPAWGTPQLIYESTVVAPHRLKIERDDIGALHVVWEYYRSENAERGLLYSELRDGIWSLPEIVHFQDGNLQLRHLDTFVDSFGNFHILAQTYSSRYLIDTYRSPSGVWSIPKEIPIDTYNGFSVIRETDDGEVFVKVSNGPLLQLSPPDMWTAHGVGTMYDVDSQGAIHMVLDTTTDYITYTTYYSRAFDSSAPVQVIPSRTYTEETYVKDVLVDSLGKVHVIWQRSFQVHCPPFECKKIASHYSQIVSDTLILSSTIVIHDGNAFPGAKLYSYNNGSLHLIMQSSAQEFIYRYKPENGEWGEIENFGGQEINLLIRDDEAHLFWKVGDCKLTHQWRKAGQPWSQEINDVRKCFSDYDIAFGDAISGLLSLDFANTVGYRVEHRSFSAKNNPTSTRTPSPTPTDTAIATDTATPTRTAIPTLTATGQSANTPTNTPSQTPTVTPTLTQVPSTPYPNNMRLPMIR